MRHPAHDEEIELGGGLSNNDKSVESTYKISGYAYTGGGRKVIRVEVSLDDGKTFMLCKTDIPEEPTKYKKYWCWVFYEIEVNIYICIYR
jgi:nitrate reductase (NAD(P)H)